MEKIARPSSIQLALAGICGNKSPYSRAMELSVSAEDLRFAYSAGK